MHKNQPLWLYSQKHMTLVGFNFLRGWIVIQNKDSHFSHVSFCLFLYSYWNKTPLKHIKSSNIETGFSFILNFCSKIPCPSQSSWLLSLRLRFFIISFFYNTIKYIPRMGVITKNFHYIFISKTYFQHYM